MSVNKTKKQTEAKARTFDIGGLAEPFSFLLFFIAFLLTENNVVQSWFTKVIPSSCEETENQWENGTVTAPHLAS